MLMKELDGGEMVAAAGLVLNQENMTARLMGGTASKVMNKCTVPKRCHAAAPSKVVTKRSSGIATKRPPDGKNTLATRTLKTPRETTRMREKTAPASHFKSSSRSREIGRQRIIR